VKRPDWLAAPERKLRQLVSPLSGVDRGRRDEGVELYGRVRHAVRIEGLSHRGGGAAVRDRPADGRQDDMFSVPPGYRRSKPPARPKLDPFIGIIDRMLEEDKNRPAKQRHTSKRIFERLRTSTATPVG